MDLPPRVTTKLKSSMRASHIRHMTDAKTNIAHSNNVVRLSAARMIDEPGAAESRAIDKVLMLP